jgi:aminopeptidase N
MNFKKITILIAFYLFAISVFASGPGSNNQIMNINHNQRSDTIDILHYHVNLNITSVTSSPISGYTDVRMVPKQNGVTTLNLDLLRLTVDSIILNNSQLTYNYNDTLLKVNLGNAYNIGDTITVRVAYHGIPQIDPSGFGGFSFSSGYAYNLGVGFSADPHVYGRVWHPCFDNFVERATYSFAITTSNNHKAVCNGLLTSSLLNPNNTITWNWLLEQDIPTYLACVAVAAYTTVHQNFSGINGSVPVELVAVPTDTTNMKNSFVKLEDAFDAFEERFGTYRWSKVGYVLVPFNGGAMEHATNIAYPKAAVTSGTTLYEAELMSHELSHHWFGDLVTCKTAEDMWLNEGWASFSAFIFTESVYGNEAYKSDLRANQAKILQFAHVKEGGYRAVSGIPHQWTYGDHVYLKGASVAHTIRGYMGDSLFFNAAKYYLNKNAFKDVTSYTMRDDFETSSGLNLFDCFNDWVFNPGFAHFSVDSFKVDNTGGNHLVTVFVRQKLTGAPNLFNNVPLEVTFMNDAFLSYTNKIIMNGQTASFTMNVPFEPTYAGLNLEGKIADAVVSQYKIIKTTGSNNLTDLKFNLNVTGISDSTFIRVEHNFAAPDAPAPWSGYTISPNRYYKIDGIFSAGFKGTAIIPYDGRSTTASGNQYLDNLLFNSVLNEDSLVLLYRKSTAHSWSVYPYYTKLASNLNDKFGTVRLDSIQKGEYAFGMKSGITGVEKKIALSQIKLIPNPTKDIVNIDLTAFPKSGNIVECSIFNAEGKWIRNHKIAAEVNQYEINLSGLANGIYYLHFNDGINYTNNKLVLNN